jgi:ribosomal protein L16/L10AE
VVKFGFGFPRQADYYQRTHLGSGKALHHFVAIVRPGTMVFEISGLPKDIAVEALNRVTQITS